MNRLAEDPGANVGAVINKEPPIAQKEDPLKLSFTGKELSHLVYGWQTRNSTHQSTMDICSANS